MTSKAATVCFSWLNNTNYLEWALRMEAVLICAGLWQMIDIIIDETGKDAATIAKGIKAAIDGQATDKMNEARAEIILRVDDGQLAHCMKSRDPREIWVTLEQVHCAAGFATNLALCRRFLTMKKTDSQTMQAWIGQAGTDITDQNKILALTIGLLSSYDSVIINFDSTSSNLLTLNHVISRLLNEEICQIASGGNSTKSDDDVQDEAMAVTSAKSCKLKLITANPDVICFFCNKKGHYKSDCPERLA
ncbi:hypothetical protein CVT26_007083 [Gymnopilus dilepis]|uniref:CCHC-type domain-containing protein n=1 Tax=Gymnopilus dilepis TaxID=231916 RepID=A0A409X0W8_9AGAR|nr:hypothetical protein CVT26_007083 [Gymnopilus dilepis]